MEITLFSPHMLRLRGKQITLLFNPIDGKVKTPVDAALFFTRIPDDSVSQQLEESKIRIDGAGEYEIGGVKIAGAKVADQFYYTVILEGIVILVGKASTLSKMKDTSQESQVVIIESDVLLDQTVAAAVSPHVILFYGEKARENITTLGKEDITPVAKFAITREKLTTDTEIVLLQ